MIKKLLMFAITSGLAAKAYKAYVAKQGKGSATGAPVSGKPRAASPLSGSEPTPGKPL